MAGRLLLTTCFMVTFAASAQSQTIEQMQAQMDCEMARTMCYDAKDMAQVASDSAFEMKATANYRRADCVGAGATGAQLVPGDDALAQGDDEYAVGDADVLAAATPRGNADGEWNAAVIFWDGGMFGSAASKYGDAKPKYDDAASKYLDAYEDYYVSAMGGYMDAYMEFDMLHMML